MATSAVFLLMIFNIFILTSANATENETPLKLRVVPIDLKILETRHSPKVFNDRRFSLDPASKINDTENKTLWKLSDVPTDSETRKTRLNSPPLFNIEERASDRRLSLDDSASNGNGDLQRRLLDLDMWFPCGQFDRCRVGRNYCSVDTSRCEICNSDVCHGSNADSMCNFMCKAFPDESSTASSGIQSSPVTITTEGCPTIVPPYKLTTNDHMWRTVAIVSLVALTLVLIPVVVIGRKRWRMRRRTANITDDPDHTSVMELAALALPTISLVSDPPGPPTPEIPPTPETLSIKTSRATSLRLAIPASRATPETRQPSPSKESLAISDIRQNVKF